MGAEPQKRMKGLRIATRCATLPQFVSQFHRYCAAKSVFISTLGTRPVGMEMAFSMDLADGTPALRGLGTVLDAWATGDNPFGRPGVHLGIKRLTKESETVLEQLLVARAVAEDRASAPVAAADPSNTDVVAVAAEQRTPGGELVLPANPLSGITDQSLEGFVDCTIFEETGTFFPIDPEEAAAADDAADPPAEPPALVPFTRRAARTPPIPSRIVPPAPPQPGSVPLSALAAASAAQSVAEAISAADVVVPSTAEIAPPQEAESDPEAASELRFPRPASEAELRFPRPASEPGPAADHEAAVMHARRKSNSISGGFIASVHPEPIARHSPPAPPVVAEDLSPRPFERRLAQRPLWRKLIEEYRWYSVGSACAVLAIVVIIAIAMHVKSPPPPAPPPVAASVPPPPPKPAPPPAADEPEAEGTPVIGKGPCRVTVTSTPAGSIVAVDGERAGPSPITIAGPCTKRQIEVAHPRYAPATRSVTLAQAKPETVDVTLQRPMHHLMIETQPSGAIVSIAGKPAGSTPTNIELMGFTSITLTIAKPGWRPMTKKIYSKVANDHLSVKLSK